MTILAFKPRLDETQKEELDRVRALIDSFSENFEAAIQWNPKNPIEQWELLSMYSIDEILKDIHAITLYDFQAVEYLIILYFSHVGEELFTDNNTILKIAESSFIKYCTGTGNHVPWLIPKYRDLALKSYYDLYISVSDETEAKFYKAVYDICPMIMEHCRKLHSKFTTTKLSIVK